MKLLLIGGPKFVGFALIEAALARGHEVTTFNRGQTQPERFPGDREAARRPRRRPLGPRGADLGRRSRHVRLRPAARPPTRPSSSPGTAGRYLFVSSISYYADYREPRVESDPPAQLGDKPADRLLEDYSNYGALKALCEQEVEARVRGPRRSSSARA